MSTAVWHALFAGTAVALAAGPIGYLLVLRSQIFTADALSHVAFTGALAALAIGWDVRVGLFTVTIVVAIGMGMLGNRGQPDDVVIGGVFAWVLGLGVFFLSFYSRGGHGSNGTAGVRVLFGSILGLDRSQTILAVVLGVLVAIVIAVIARPMLFASLDPLVAMARGVPVALLGWGFLALLGITAAEASQVVGSLLILGLLSAPAGAAMRLTDRPLRGMAVAGVIAVLSVWGGIAIAQAFPKIPPSFAIIALAAAVYLIATIAFEPERSGTDDYARPIRSVRGT
jgi:zinc/manganese transport system permease protein